MKAKVVIVSILILMLALNVSTAKVTNEKGKDYECVAIEKDIATPPSDINKGKNGIDGDIVKEKGNELCSNGKVPKLSVEADKEFKDKDGKYLKKVHPDKRFASATLVIGSDGKYHDWGYSSMYVINKGAVATLGQHSPYVNFWTGIFSLAQIGVSGCYDIGCSGGNGYVETGWMKSYWPWSKSRLFVAWWKNGNTFCFNGCGWVQVSTSKYPGMSVDTSSRGTYAIANLYGNWWVYYNGEWIGYYPGSLWNNKWNKGNTVHYYGEVASITSTTSTDMGTGYFASDSRAALILDEQYLNNDYWWRSANTTKWASSPSRYSVYSLSSRSMRYGGPGNNGVG